MAYTEENLHTFGNSDITSERGLEAAIHNNSHSVVALTGHEKVLRFMNFLPLLELYL